MDIKSEKRYEEDDIAVSSNLKAACVPGETGMHPQPISVSTDGSLRSSQGPILSQLWLKVRFHSETEIQRKSSLGVEVNTEIQPGMC